MSGLVKLSVEVLLCSVLPERGPAHRGRAQGAGLRAAPASGSESRDVWATGPLREGSWRHPPIQLGKLRPLVGSPSSPRHMCHLHVMLWPPWSVSASVQGWPHPSAAWMGLPTSPQSPMCPLSHAQALALPSPSCSQPLISPVPKWGNQGPRGGNPPRPNQDMQGPEGTLRNRAHRCQAAVLAHPADGDRPAVRAGGQALGGVQEGGSGLAPPPQMEKESTVSLGPGPTRLLSPAVPSPSWVPPLRPSPPPALASPRSR